MKKLLLFLSIVLTFNAFGEKISIEQAKQIAETFITKSNSSNLKSASSLELYDAGDLFADNQSDASNSNREIYAFNIGSNKGFILISGDDAALPVLGYSNAGHINKDSIPSNALDWLEGYKQQILYIQNNNITPTASIKAVWNGQINSLKATQASVEPLLTTHWNQSVYYNDLCPYDEDYQRHTVTGCVATAMAQIMKYWNYPEKGIGSHSYTYGKYGVISANFGETYYDWDAMPNRVFSPNNAVATLMFHCGVAVNMMYGPYSSSAYSNDWESALPLYFGYSSSLSYEARSLYNDDEWKAILIGELDALRPIYHRGRSLSSGHAFVCDGYDENYYFHFNWGWGGLYDGYYLNDALNPDSRSYNLHQYIFTGIQPPQPTNYTLIDDDVEVVDGIIVNCSYDFTISDIVIPETLDGQTVLGIDYNVFSNKSITNVDLPNTLTSIGKGAFYTNELSSLTIPESVTSIGPNAFNNNAIEEVNGSPSSGIIYARNLDGRDDSTTIVSYGGVADVIDFIPSNVTNIGQWAFYGNSLSGITIPTSITYIGQSAFINNQLTGFTLPKAEKEGFTFIDWNSSITANTWVTDLTTEYKANFTETVYYTVIFIDWDGTIISEQSVESGASAAAPDAPTRNGYSFIGWNIAFNNITSDLTIIAQYDDIVNGYTVQFVDWDGTVLSKQTVNYNTGAIAPDNPLRIGYIFIGWVGDFSHITSNFTITTKYKKADSHTVKFVDWNGTVLSKQTVEYGGYATAPDDPAREHYTFAGWNIEFNSITRDLTITAQYKANYYNVIFKDWDGTILSEQSVKYGTAAIKPKIPSKEGYIFNGWDYDYTFITEDITITATYRLADSYIVKFVDWDETVLSEQTVAYNTGAIAPDDPLRIGYIFDGWVGDFSHITSDFTVTTKYKKADSHTVVFVDWDGTVLSKQTVEYGGYAIAPDDPTREHYTFAGWNIEFSSITRDLTITAQYKANRYTVVFKDWDGTILDEQSVKYGRSATPPVSPTREGYILAGWDENYKYVIEDLTITAIYDINKNVESELIITTYPNPANNFVHLSIDELLIGQSRYELRNIYGKLIVGDDVNGSPITINIGEIQPGTYFLIIYKDQVKIKSIQVIKQ